MAGPELIPESVKIAGYLGGAGFAVWIFKVAWELFDKARSKNGKGNDANGKKLRCIGTAAWALHDKKGDDIKQIVDSINVEREKQTGALNELVSSGRRQEEILKDIAKGLSYRQTEKGS